MDTNDYKDQNHQQINNDDENMIKPNIQLIQLKNHLVLQHKFRQLYLHIFLQYL